MTSTLFVLLASVTAFCLASRTSNAAASSYFEREARESMLLPSLEATDEWRRQRDELLQDVLEQLHLRADDRQRLRDNNDPYIESPRNQLSEVPLPVCRDSTGSRVLCPDIVSSREVAAGERPAKDRINRRPNTINTLVKRNRMLAYWRRRPDETSKDEAYDDDSFGINVSETKEMVKRYKSTAYDCIALYCANKTLKERYNCILRECHHAE